MSGLALKKTEHVRASSGKRVGWETSIMEVGTSISSIPAEFREQWAALAKSASEPNPFFEHWNLSPALDHLVGDAEISLMFVRDPQQLIGLLPFNWSARYYGRRIPHLRVWLHDNSFCGVPLVRKGCELDFWNCTLDHLDADPPAALLLHLAQLPAESPVTNALFTVLSERQHPASIVLREERAMLASNLDAQSYFNASLSTKKRKELRRQARRLGELGDIAFERRVCSHGLDQWIDTFLELEHSGWKGREGSSLASSQANSRYFREALKGGTEAGRIERLSLTLDGKPVAMLASFLAPPGSFSFKTAFDEAYSRYSPGVLLQKENLALLDRGDIAWCDSCAAGGHPMIERIWREKRKMIAVNIALGGSLRRGAFKLMRMVERSAENTKRDDQMNGKAEMPRSTGQCRASSSGPFLTFDRTSRARFAELYPEHPHALRHALDDHPLLTLDSLAKLAARLPTTSIEYNRGDLPIGIDGKPGETGMGIEETIRHIASANSWAVLKNIEQDASYQELLLSLLNELQEEIETKTGTMLRPQGFIFISSPRAVTPYHFDPEHNILLQLQGSKTMTQFPAGDIMFAADEVHESYHAGGPRELSWNDTMLEHGREFPISPGEAVFVPVMAPHFVRVGPESSISLSITWRSDWSFAEADARGFNRLMRGFGFSPAMPGRWPHGNQVKSLTFRLLRKLGATS